jgi:hypothetical protein
MAPQLMLDLFGEALWLVVLLVTVIILPSRMRLRNSKMPAGKASSPCVTRRRMSGFTCR